MLASMLVLRVSIILLHKIDQHPHLRLIGFCIVAGSAFMVGRTLTAVLWGIVADRYGRKPVIIFSVMAVLVLSGFSSTAFCIL